MAWKWFIYTSENPNMDFQYLTSFDFNNYFNIQHAVHKDSVRQVRAQ